MFALRRSSHVLRFFQSGAPALQVKHSSTFNVLTPPKHAPREAPTPLVFCSASYWDLETRKGIPEFTSMLAEKGYTCIDSNFEPPCTGDIPLGSQSLMDYLCEELKVNLRLSGSPFPPVVFARGFASLIAQTYISSNPAHGLFLISPPLSNALLFPGVLPTPLAEFDYELNFPIAVMARSAEMVQVRKSSRLGRDEYVDLIELDDLEGDNAFLKIEQWLDELGI